MITTKSITGKVPAYRPKSINDCVSILCSNDRELVINSEGYYTISLWTYDGDKEIELTGDDIVTILRDMVNDLESRKDR